MQRVSGEHPLDIPAKIVWIWSTVRKTAVLAQSSVKTSLFAFEFQITDCFFLGRYASLDPTDLFDVSLLISLTGLLFSSTASIGAACAVTPMVGTFKHAQCKMRDRGMITMAQSQTLGQDGYTTGLKRSERHSRSQSRPLGDVGGSAHTAHVPISQARPRPISAWNIPEKAHLFQVMDGFAREWVDPSLSLTRRVPTGCGLCRTPRKSNAARLTAVPSPLHHHTESSCHEWLANLHAELCGGLRT